MKDNKSNPNQTKAPARENNKTPQKTLVPTEWWLDYAEGELDVASRAEMKSLLKHSKGDQEIVQAYQETKGVVAAAMPEIPEISDDFMDSLHDKIMANVEQKAMKPAPKVFKKASHRKFAAATSSLFVLFVLSFGLVKINEYNKSLNTHTPDIAQQLLEQALESPESFAQFVSYQDANDFFVDVASRQADDLSIDQFDQLMGRKDKVR